MSNLSFRTLRAEEIECRVAQSVKGGVSLLLYKDARCDQNILDETVGAMGWQKRYDLIDGQLFCTIEIWDDEKGMWISKQDVGTESNTEAEKGRASDAQKRAAFAWGIGRELYSAPFIYIPESNFEPKEKNGKITTFDRFAVEEISYTDERKIKTLSIVNLSKKITAFTYGKGGGRKKKDEPEIVTSVAPAGQKKAPTLQEVGAELKALCEEYGYDLTTIIKDCRLTKESVLHDYINAVQYVKDRARIDGKV